MISLQPTALPPTFVHITPRTTYTQFVSVVVFAQYKLYLYEHWYLISLQPNDFKPTFVHITLLRLHSICICTRICICLDRIHHCASKQNVSKSDLEKLSIFVSEKEMVQYISSHLQLLSTFMSCSRPVFAYTQSLYFCICNL